MKTFHHILCMAALTVAGTMLLGCSPDDIIVDNPVVPVTTDNDSIVTLTTTISLDGNPAATRALTDKGRKTFAVGDRVAVFYKDYDKRKIQRATSNALTADDISSNGKSATITVSMSIPYNSSLIRIVYPAAMAKTAYNGNFIVNDDAYTIDFDQLNEQDGTLETIGSNYDLATFDGMLDGDALPSHISLTNRLAICEFTVKDGSSDITNDITGLSVTNGTNSYRVTRSAGAGPIYVAMQPVTSGNIVMNATDDKKNYQKIVWGKTLAASSIYPVRVSMAKTNAKILDFITAEYEAQNGETLTGALHNNVKISIAAGATVTLSNVIIKGTNDSNYQWAGITCLGNATLVLDGTNSVTGFHCSCPGIQPAHNDTGSGDEYTLTIQGSGSLTASSSGSYPAGAGIGSSNNGTCGNIIINGGTITATGTSYAAGIGTGMYGTCGTITITEGVTRITATKGSSADNIIGRGRNDSGSCGTVTIDGVTDATPESTFTHFDSVLSNNNKKWTLTHK